MDDRSHTPSPSSARKASRDRHFDPSRSAWPLHSGERVLAVSDMHYGVVGREYIAGRGRSYYREADMTEMLTEAMKHSEHLVLCGDIFETVYGKGRDKAAMRHHYEEIVDQWLEAASHTGCRIHMLIGNHDDSPKLVKMLERKAARMPERFTLHPVALRLGPSLFIHGDIPLRMPQYDDMSIKNRFLGREKFMGQRMVEGLPDRTQHWAEGLAKFANSKVHFMAQRVTDLMRHPQRAVNLLYANLHDSSLVREMETADGSVLPPVTDVISGHTHMQYLGLQARDEEGNALSALRFHNTGTAVEQKRFHPLLLRLDEHRALEVEPFPISKLLPPQHDRYRQRPALSR